MGFFFYVACKVVSNVLKKGKKESVLSGKAKE